MYLETNQSEKNIEKLEYYKKVYGLKQRNSSKETAFALNIADQTLRHSRSTGYLLGTVAPSHIKLGRLVQYRIEDIVQWIEQNETATYGEVA